MVFLFIQKEKKTMNDYIGKYVKQFESGSKGSLALGSCGNDWGLSCGSYQLTLRWGNCIRFLKQYFPDEAKSLYFSAKRDKASKYWPGSAYCSRPSKVKSVWKKCYKKVGADKFFEYEHKYMEQNYYLPIKQKISPYINLDHTSRAFQECFWSWAIHRGASGAYNEFVAALNGRSVADFDMESLFDLIYDKRYQVFPNNRYKKDYAKSEREILRDIIYAPGLGVHIITSPVLVKPAGEDKMKYNENNQPIVCMMTNSSCYQGTRKMNILGVLWHSTGANNPMLRRYVQPSETDSNYEQLMDLLGKNSAGNDWNHIKHMAGVNAWIGKTADGAVETVQTLPWDFRPWGCGSGKNGSCNSGWIQFEICEDNLANPQYFEQVYKEGCELTAYLCKLFNINPKGTVKVGDVEVPTILCHADACKLGLGSNHADVNHWFPKYGKSMATVRDDVAELIGEPLFNDEEEEDMTQERFNELMNNYLVELAKQEPSAWSQEARDFCEKNGIINGDQNGNRMYKKFLTREEMAALIYRLHNEEK